MAEIRIEFRVTGKKFKIHIGKKVFTYLVTGLLVRNNEVFGYETKLSKEDITKLNKILIKNW